MNIFRQFKICYYCRNYLNHKNMSGTSIKPSPCLSKVPGAAKRLVWVDLEMTGLDFENDKILEIACVITDGDLNILATGPDIVINQPESVLNNMNSWCVEHHGESGLTEKSLKSKITLSDAENQVLNFIKKYVPEKRCPMAGNSIWMDRLFLAKHMPTFNNYLHYRNIDVSTIKELAKRWHQKDYSKLPDKAYKHRAVSDILESIEELKFYRQNIFK